ncbi:hypothetical protein EDB85DRAFT_2160463 [Lactarius pseudohatsudake]|nr:hypothetical protein EDB85DRAFT_2160463 [Lactarius pseudohatsudake]
MLSNSGLRLSSFRSHAGRDSCCLSLRQFTEELSAIEQWFELLSEVDRTAALWSLLQHSTQVQIPFFITVLQQIATDHPMTALLSPAVGVAWTQIYLPVPLLPAPLTPAPTGPLVACLRLLFLFPIYTANTVDNPSDAAATLAQQRAKLKAAGNAAHRISAPALASNGERHPVRSANFSGLSAGSASCSPHPDGGTTPGGLDGLSPVAGDSWASMVNTPLLPMSQKTFSSNNNNAGQTIDLAAAKLNDLYGSSNVPRLDSPDKSCRPFKGHVHDNMSGRFGRSDDGSNAMTPVHQQVALAGLWMGDGGFNLGLAEWHESVRHEYAGHGNPQCDGHHIRGAAQIAAAGGGFGQPGLGVGASLGSFGGLQGGMGSNGLRGGSGRSGGQKRSAGSGGAKKVDEDFEPAVLNDVAGWLRTLWLHKYTPNFEGMTWKEMVVMDEQALEAQGSEVVRKKMGIDDPTAPPPPPLPSGGPAPGAPGSAGSGGLSA